MFSRKSWGGIGLRFLVTAKRARAATLFESLKLKMALKNDFSLETVILQANHKVIFCPKPHLEVYYIEYYWAELK